MSTDRKAFTADTHGAKYVKVLDEQPAATARFFELINEPCNEHRLLDAQALGHPALDGIVRFLDTDSATSVVIETNQRFRQAVGVGVRLKMEELGWTTTGIKGPVRSANFSRAERYSPA